MMNDLTWARTLYRKLVTLYPRQFREQLGESMEQTFHDLCQEQHTKTGLFGFVFWTFTETTIGVLKEHLLLVSPGVFMQTTLKTFGSSLLIGFIVILPLMIMEVVNRQNLNEEFPTFLFLVMWLNLFAVSSILLPIVQSRRTGRRDVTDALPIQGNTFITKPWSAAIVSVIVFLAPGVLPLLEYLGWLSLDRLFNGPNPGVTYLPGMFLTLGLFLFPVAAGIIAGRPVVNTLQAGGRLFAHPINLILVVFIAGAFAYGFGTLLIDQWTCFIGVPNCD